MSVTTKVTAMCQICAQREATMIVPASLRAENESLLTRNRALEGENAALAARCEKMEQALRAYVLAQGRMLDRWADGDDNVKRYLWKNLHACEDAARKALASQAEEK